MENETRISILTKKILDAKLEQKNFCEIQKMQKELDDLIKEKKSNNKSK